MNWFQKTLDAIRNNADAIKFALILPAAAWAYFEYDAKQTEAKVERTLSYVKQADQGELLAAEMKMTAFWIREDVVKERDVVPKGDKVAFDKFMASKTRTHLLNEVWPALNFYKSLSICVKMKLCNSTSACQRFARDMKVFVENYRAYFVEYRAVHSDDALKPLNEMLNNTCI